MLFEEAFKQFHEEQIRHAKGRRLEMLQKDLVGEKKLLREVIWPVFKSFDGFTLEYEIKSLSGVTIFLDIFFEPLLFVFESEGFVPHAEAITRERFSFERMRIRTFAAYGYKFIPFSWDELDKSPELCRRQVYELMGRYSVTQDKVYEDLSPYERELIRYALRLNRPFELNDVCYCLQLEQQTSRKIVRNLLEKGMVKPLGEGKVKIRKYMLTERAAEYIL